MSDNWFTALSVEYEDSEKAYKLREKAQSAENGAIISALLREYGDIYLECTESRCTLNHEGIEYCFSASSRSPKILKIIVTCVICGVSLERQVRNRSDLAHVMFGWKPTAKCLDCIQLEELVPVLAAHQKRLNHFGIKKDQFGNNTLVESNVGE